MHWLCVWGAVFAMAVPHAAPLDSDGDMHYTNSAACAAFLKAVMQQ